MNYDQKLVIRRPVGTADAPTGQMNLEDGTWLDDDSNPSNDTGVICTTRCDAQDKPVVMTATEAGVPTSTADVQAFLYIERVISLIQLNDLCDITWEDGTTETMTVVQIRRLDASVLLRRSD